MKKIFVVLLFLCLLLAISVPVFATGTLNATASQSSVYRGKEFTVTISISGVDAYKRGGITVTYDSNFELVGGNWLIASAQYTEFDIDDKIGTFICNEPETLSGPVFVLKFRAKDDASFETGDISVKITLGSTASGTEISGTAKVAVACNHKYSSWSNSGASGHNHKCSICGKTESASHTYDNACDTSCNGCGATRSITHSFGEEWVTDETGHWHACTTCGEKTDEAEHIPGEPAGEYTDQICTECEYVLELALGHVHTYDKTYLTDASSHWQKCLGCGEANDPAPHIYSNDCDTTCDTCNYERAVLHNEGEKWLNSTQDHWKVCADCKARLYQAKHQWDAGTVIQEAALNQTGKVELHCQTCGAIRVDDLPALSLTQALAWWVWLIIGVVGGMILAVVIGMAIILPQILRKSKGRFAH